MYTNKHARSVYYTVSKQTNMVKRAHTGSSKATAKKAKGFVAKARKRKHTRKPAKVAKTAGLLSNYHEQTFKRTISYALEWPDWDYQDNIDMTAHLVKQVYEQLYHYEGFTKVVQRYQQVKPVELAIKMRLTKNAFGRTFGDRLNQSTPGATDNDEGLTGGNIPSNGCWNYAEVLAAVDFDGKDGLGGQLKYNRSDFRAAGNTSQNHISSGAPKLIAKYPLKQYIKIPPGQAQVAVPVTKNQQWFTQGVFNDLTVPATAEPVALTSQPTFGGCNFAVISYDAVGNGYTGTTQNKLPCMGVTVEYVLRCQFKGEVLK